MTERRSLRHRGRVANEEDPLVDIAEDDSDNDPDFDGDGGQPELLKPIFCPRLLPTCTCI